MLADGADEAPILKDLIEARLKALGLNPFEAARRGGFERHFVNDILIGKKRSVRGANLVRLARALEVSPEFFVLTASRADPAAGFGPEAGAGADDVVLVPEYDVVVSAGPGRTVDQEAVRDVWRFPRNYLVRELRLNPTNLSVVTVSGDSMQPTLHSGDKVLVDHSDKDPAKSGIYAVWDANATVVKRLEKVPASDPPMLVLLSDNKNHHDYTVPADLVSVIGRVVWFGRRM